MSIYVGTTNFDGSGSAINLNEFNATAINLYPNETVYSNGALLSNISDATIVSVDEWNKVGYKEAKVDNDSDLVLVENFVDVDIDNHSDQATIGVFGAKRGHIDTADGDDFILIEVYSNAPYWDNTFYVNSGAGDDVVYLTHSHNSQYTSFDIDLGEGDDILDVADLQGPNSGDPSVIITREADGGAGNDMLYFSGEDTVSFENFEAVIGYYDAGLTLTKEVLQDNNAEVDGLRDGTLLISNSGMTIGCGLYTTNIQAITDAEAAYIDSFNMGFNPDSFVWIEYTESSYECCDSTFAVLIDTETVDMA